MYNQPEVALEQYELKVEQITRGRGAYICGTDVGTKLLVPYKGSEERARFLREIMMFLQAQGMPAEQILETKEGTVLSKDDSETNYILKDYVVGTECNTKNLEELEVTFRELAKLHSIMEHYHEPIPLFLRTEKEDLLGMCKKHYRELVNVKNYIRCRKRKNEFEMLFQGNFEHFAEHANRAISYFEGMEGDSFQRLLCHGDYNQHNVLRVDGEWRIVNFERISYHFPMSDLANYLRKMMEKNQWNIEMGGCLLESYQKVRKFSSMEWKQLGYLLLFPEKFWKISNHYGNTRKSWVSGRDIEKLEMVLEQEKYRMAFLEQIFSL